MKKVCARMFFKSGDHRKEEKSCFKGIVHPKKINLSLKLFQTCVSFFQLTAAIDFHSKEQRKPDQSCVFLSDVTDSCVR